MLRLRLLEGLRFLEGLAALTLLVTPAVAQNSGTDAEQEACTPDVFRLCQAYIPNEAPIVACLKLNRERLSPACHQVFFPAASAGPTTTPVHHKRKRHRHVKQG